MVRCLDSYLLSHIYRSNDSIIAETILHHAFYEKLTKNRNPLSLIDNYLYSTPDQDVYKLYNEFRKKNKIRIGSDDFLEPLSIQTSTSKVFEQEEDINDVISRFISTEKNYGRLLFDVTRLPQSDRNTITIYINKNYEFKRVGLLPNIIKMITGEVIRNEPSKYNPLFKEIRNELIFQLYAKREINENNLVNIFRFLTRVIFDKKIGFIRFKSKKVRILPDAFFDRRYYKKQCLLEQVINKKIVNNPEIVKLKELMCYLLEKRMKGKPKFLVYTFNTELQRERVSAGRWGFIAGEFDGALLEVRGTKIFMYILEAKKKTRSYSESRRQLNRIKSYLKERYRKSGICKIERIKKRGKSGFLRIKLS